MARSRPGFRAAVVDAIGKIVGGTGESSEAEFGFVWTGGR
jgi:4-hydroxy-3-methylbut-2-en-1-yl diphosphate synthase IspG/GcpE